MKKYAIFLLAGLVAGSGRAELRLDSFQRKSFATVAPFLATTTCTNKAGDVVVMGYSPNRAKSVTAVTFSTTAGSSIVTNYSDPAVNPNAAIAYTRITADGVYDFKGEITTSSTVSFGVWVLRADSGQIEEVARTNFVDTAGSATPPFQLDYSWTGGIPAGGGMLVETLASRNELLMPSGGQIIDWSANTNAFGFTAGNRIHTHTNVTGVAVSSPYTPQGSGGSIDTLSAAGFVFREVVTLQPVLYLIQ